jgi:hypothetical protein
LLDLIFIIGADGENANQKAMCSAAWRALFSFAVAFSASAPALGEGAIFFKIDRQSYTLFVRLQMDELRRNNSSGAAV